MYVLKAIEEWVIMVVPVGPVYNPAIKSAITKQTIVLLMAQRQETTMLACFLLGSAFACTLVIVIYRLHLHPLSKFPGPRLAAVTGLYEIYFMAWEHGFDKEILRMHRRYGNILVDAATHGSF